jgi:UDP-N-acetylmuramyl pentapeptide synthase
VKFYLQTLLQSKFNVLVTPESYNTPMGVVKTLRGSLKPTHEIFVCEMGARYVGDIKEICDIVHPDMGVITSIGPQHLETFGDMAHIQSTKFELADALPKGGKLFLNGDNDYIQEKAVSYNDKVFYYSEKKGEGYTSEILSVSQYGTEFSVTAPNGETETFRMKLIGAHNVINVVGAISVANTLGIPLKDLIVPVRRIQPVEHRMQMRPHGDVTIIDDAYNSNPVGSKAAVETLKMFDGARILVTPGMVELGDKEEEFNYKFGTYAADCCDYIILVGKEDHIAPIRKGAIDSSFPEDKLKSFAKLEEALEYAYKIKDEGHKYILLENDLPDNY